MYTAYANTQNGVILMRYVLYGKTGLTVSRFGLGCMRFPGEEAEAIDMVRYAIDHGVNYLLLKQAHAALAE